MMKSVIVDLDGTLLDRNAPVEQFISVQCDRLTEHLSHIPKNDYIARFIELDCHGHAWKDKIYQALVAEFAIEGISWQSLLEDYKMQFQYHCVPFQVLCEMLNELKQHGYLLGISLKLYCPALWQTSRKLLKQQLNHKRIAT